MSDLTPERLAEWREDSLSAIRDGFGLEPEDVGDIADTRIVVLIDALESARTERDEAQMERSDARAEVERLRDRWRDDVTGQDLVEGNAQLGDEVIRLRAKVARVEELAAEWKRLPGGVVIDVQAEVTDPFTAALADEGDNDA